MRPLNVPLLLPMRVTEISMISQERASCRVFPWGFPNHPLFFPAAMGGRKMTEDVCMRLLRNWDNFFMHILATMTFISHWMERFTMVGTQNTIDPEQATL